MPAARKEALALALAGALALALPSGASALTLKTCRHEPSFGCGVLQVPLDHAGRAHGTLKLAVAAQRRHPKDAGLLVALSGGPGQSSVEAVEVFAASMAPTMRRYRLVTIDQRGTGLSGALSCPELQGLGTLDPFTPAAVLRCERGIGPRRAFFSTKDTVGDLEALRKAFGAKKLAIMGVSYGTWVALEYARAHPARTDRLILDSVVGPEPPDPFFLDSYRTLPRVMREQCANRRCKGVTKDPVGDLAAVLDAVRKAPIAGDVYDTRGRPRKTVYATEEQLSFLVTAGDLNPFMQARLPGALASARAGDPAALLRLRRIAEGAPTKTKDLSFALNVTTACLDAGLPWPLDSDPSARPALAGAALAAIPPAEYAPWSAETVRSSSYVDDCLLFPRQRAPASPPKPLPDVPALLFAGRLDTRTPAENARATAKLLPRAQVVEVPGNGHDQLDTDATGCAERALRRFIAGRQVGRCAKGGTNQVDVLPTPPRSIREFRRPAKIAGDRGRVLLAVLDSASDARVSALEALYAGLSPRGGGLRGGSFSATDPFDGVLSLRDFAYVPGVRLTGALRVRGQALSGRVRVSGKIAGALTLSASGDASGVLGGRRVAYRAGAATKASAAGGRGGAARRGPAPATADRRDAAGRYPAVRRLSADGRFSGSPAGRARRT